SEEGSCEFLGKLGLPVKRAQHGMPFYPVKRRALYCGGTTHPEGLANQATFTKKIAWAQNHQYRFGSHGRYHSDFHLSCLKKVNGFGCVTLREDLFILAELQYGLPFCNCFEQIREIRIRESLRRSRLRCFDRRCFLAAGSERHICV